MATWNPHAKFISIRHIFLFWVFQTKTSTTQIIFPILSLHHLEREANCQQSTFNRGCFRKFLGKRASSFKVYLYFMRGSSECSRILLSWYRCLDIAVSISLSQHTLVLLTVLKFDVASQYWEDDFCQVCASSLSEPVPWISLFFGIL